MGQTKGVDITSSLSAILPEIQSLIETSRHHVAITANLALVNLYWQIGRIITEDINKNAKRAEYGAQLIEKLSESLLKMYGRGYSPSNLQDMRRFFETFRICQPLVNEFASPPILQPLAGQSDAPEIFQPLAGESDPDTWSKASEDGITERIPIDFTKHYHLGWTHYRILLGISEPLKRSFYFERAASGRWSKREIQRQIEGALFERVHLSRDTRKLVALEKKKAAPEIIRYEDIFKDPYLRCHKG